MRKGSSRGTSFRSMNSMNIEILNTNKTSHSEQTLTPIWNERFQ